MSVLQPHKPHKSPRTAVLSAVALAALTLSACSSGPNTAAPPRTAGTPAPSATPSPSARPVHPFTGRPGARNGPVLAVKIDNTRSAKPQRGLRSADIVYVEQVEGGLSRIMAVYSSTLPPQIGPVRSARISDLHLLPQFGRPAFAYSGVQSKMKPYLARTALVDVSPDTASGAYARGGPHPAPYNLYASPRRLLAKAPGATKARDIGFRFGAAPPGGTATTSYTARYPSSTLVFHWSAGEHRWLVSQDGRPDQAAEGGRLGGRTIVIQRVRTTRSQFHDFLGNYTPLLRTVGTGTATVLRDGKAYDVRWSRASEDRGTTFTTPSGRPMTFAPGQVWVVLVNAGRPVTP
ncbi:DUF3048 domain-containing protein [Actinoallomurus spadix]|uniref:DUF3048 domain-containing protein n=1 Tax=Actinoallomurus spadix TaxID=79912 RepID=A0ABP3FH11_9ACTN|nr:DUF3048 domain-containing protein [Actinoallomurus spadix]MCO5985734.1 DUF3048 domain-containing protein [Actinoallomurus spadix]